MSHPQPRSAVAMHATARTEPPQSSTDDRELPPGLCELAPMAFALHATTPKGENGLLPLPKWVHLSPGGEEDPDAPEGRKHERIVRGRDGRKFAIGDVSRVTQGTELPMQFDWDHRSVYYGGETRAGGWIDHIEYVETPDEERPEPGFWGRVERWTPDGRSDVEQGYYRGLSPVVRYEYRTPTTDGDEAPAPLLVGFVNVALTNRPNLKMTLLNGQAGPSPESSPQASTPPSSPTRAAPPVPEDHYSAERPAPAAPKALSRDQIAIMDAMGWSPEDLAPVVKAERARLAAHGADASELAELDDMHAALVAGEAPPASTTHQAASDAAAIMHAAGVTPEELERARVAARAAGEEV